MKSRNDILGVEEQRRATVLSHDTRGRGQGWMRGVWEVQGPERSRTEEGAAHQNSPSSILIRSCSRS